MIKKSQLIINRDSLISNCLGQNQRQGAIVDVSVVKNGLVGVTRFKVELEVLHPYGYNPETV